MKAPLRKWDDVKISAMRTPQLLPKWTANGIECPMCQKELFDNNSMFLITNPPQIQVKCLDCGFRDYRFSDATSYDV